MKNFLLLIALGLCAYFIGTGIMQRGQASAETVAQAQARHLPAIGMDLQQLKASMGEPPTTRELENKTETTTLCFYPGWVVTLTNGRVTATEKDNTPGATPYADMPVGIFPIPTPMPTPALKASDGIRNAMGLKGSALDERPRH